MGSGRFLLGALVVALVAGCGGRSAADERPDGVFAPSFAGPDRLVSNERAYREPAGRGVAVSRDWTVTSGSLFARDGAGWTGVPDGGSPGPASANATGSAVFRAVSREHTFADVVVTTRVRVDRLVQTARTPARDWDGVHLFLRYRDANNLYTVDAHRRDGALTVKRKRGGDYEILGEVDHPVPRGRWVDVHASARTTADGVRIALRIDRVPVLTVTDTSGEAISGAGRVGIRGDNCEFSFRDYRAWTPQTASPRRLDEQGVGAVVVSGLVGCARDQRPRSRHVQSPPCSG